MVWLADQNALQGHYKLGRVVSTNPDHRGIVRDVNMRTFPSYPVPIKKRKAPVKHQKSHPQSFRDVRRLVVLLPIKEQL